MDGATVHTTAGWAVQTLVRSATMPRGGHSFVLLNKVLNFFRFWLLAHSLWLTCLFCNSWICNQAVETSFEISFELAERPKGTQTRSAAGPRAKSSNSAAHRNPELIGPALWKRLQDHGVDVHISIDGFVPHAATRVVRARTTSHPQQSQGPVFNASRFYTMRTYALCIVIDSACITSKRRCWPGAHGVSSDEMHATGKSLFLLCSP